MARRGTSRVVLLLGLLLIAGGAVVAWQMLSDTSRPIEDGLDDEGSRHATERRDAGRDPDGDGAGREDSRKDEDPVASTDGRETTPPPDDGNTSELTGWIVGEVGLAGGGYADGVTVRLVRPGRPDSVKRVRPDTAGRYRFDDLAPGRYYLEAEHERLAGVGVYADVDAENESIADPIVLRAGGSILVRVLDETDAPLRGQSISVRDPAESTSIVVGKTDDDGAVVIGPFAPGRYRVEWMVGGARPSHHVTVVPDEEVEVIFRAGGAVQGRLLGPDGKPTPGAHLRLVPSPPSAERSTIQTTADDAGVFAIQPVPEGTYDLQVQVLGTPGYLVTLARLTLSARQVIEREFRIRDTGYSGLIVRADNGDPLDRSSIQITAHPAGASPTTPMAAMAFADARGEFDLIGLAPGRYEIWFAALAPEFADQRVFVEIGPTAPTERVRHEISARTTGILRVTVTEADGSPAAGMSFGVIQELDGGLVERSLGAKKIEEGVFELTLEAGEQQIVIKRRGFVLEPKSVEITIHAGATVESTVRLVPK